MSHDSLGPALTGALTESLHPAVIAAIGPISTSFFLAVSVRLLIPTYTGAALRIRRSSDNTELDINFLGDGSLDVAQATTFIGGATGFVVTWYNQNGTTNHPTQAVQANQPEFVANDLNGRAGVDWVAGIPNRLVMANSARPDVNTPYSTSLVLTQDAALGAINLLMSSAAATNGEGVMFTNGAGSSFRINQLGTHAIGLPVGSAMRLAAYNDSTAAVPANGEKFVNEVSITGGPIAATRTPSHETDFAIGAGAAGSFNSGAHCNEMIWSEPRMTAMELTALASAQAVHFFPLLLNNLAGAAPTFAFSVRWINAAYTGPCMRIRRASDNTEQNFNFLANGNLDVATIATFLAATTGFIVTWFDQSGNGNDITQAVQGDQPPYLAVGLNGFPQVDCRGVLDRLTTATAGINTAAAETFSSIVTNPVAVVRTQVPHSVADNKFYEALDPENYRSGFGFANTGIATGGSIRLFVRNDAVPPAVGTVNAFVEANGVQIAVGNGTTTPFRGVSPGTQFSVGGDASINNSSAFSEHIHWNNFMTLADKAIMDADQLAYFGI